MIYLLILIVCIVVFAGAAASGVILDAREELRKQRALEKQKPNTTTCDKEETNTCDVTETTLETDGGDVVDAGVETIAIKTRYYLRKQDTVTDRALYCVGRRRYRQTYEHPTNSHMKLWTCATLRTAARERVALYKYCGEWFDVYTTDDNVCVDIQVVTDAFKPSIVDNCWTTQTLYYDKLENKVVTEKPAHKDYTTLRKGMRLNVYEAQDWFQSWDRNLDVDDIEERNCVVAVNSRSMVLYTFDNYSQLLFEHPQEFETKLERNARLEVAES